MRMQRYTIGVTTDFGLEAVTQRELRDVLGIAKAPADNGMLTFEGTAEDIVRCNMYLRTAERVFVVVGAKENVTTFDDLFDFVESLPWAAYLPEDARVHVHGKSAQSVLYGVPACQSITKKAIVVALKKAYHTPVIEESGVEYDVTVRLTKDKALLLIDTSGVGLHKRGYRNLVGEAAIKETMAAGLLLLSVWNPQKPLVDPFCGSGTIPIEAALMARNVAPGLRRTHACDSWTGFDSISRTVREEAQARIRQGGDLRIAGFDVDPAAVKLSRTHAANAGVADDVHFQCMDMREVRSSHPYGVIVTNPPYGERLLDDRQVDTLMRDFWQVYVALPDWSLYLISAYPFLEQAFGRKADKNRKMYNGKIQCRLYQYMGKKPPKSNV